MKLWLVPILFVATMIGQGLALECFICPDCAQPFDRQAHTAQECTMDNLFPDTPATTTTTVAPTTTTTDPPSTIDPDTDSTTLPTPSIPTDDTTISTEVPPLPDTTTPPTTISTTASIPTVPGPPQTTDSPITSAPSRFRRAAAAANSEFRCFVTQLESTTRRGCTRWLASEAETCSAIGGDGCKTCNESGCNSATSLATSLVAMLLAAVVVMRVM